MRLIDADALEVVCFKDKGGCFSDGVQWVLEKIDALPTIEQPELDGYSIEQLLFIAKLMESANVTPETLVNTIKDVEKTVRLVFELVKRQSEDAIMKIIMNGEVTE